MDNIRLDMAAVKPTMAALGLLAVEIVVIQTVLHFIGSFIKLPFGLSDLMKAS